MKIQRQATSRYNKLQSTDKEMRIALNVSLLIIRKVITSILGGLNGRKVELIGYMGKIEKPENLKKTIAWIFEELETEKLNPKLLQLTQDNTHSTLFDYVNSKSVNQLLNEAVSSYRQLEVH